MIPSPIWRYVCECEHQALRREPVVRPASDRIDPAQLARLSSELHAQTMFAWFTDLTEPDAAALGLFRHTVGCRLRFRWLVVAMVPRPVPYLSVRSGLPLWTRHAIEDEPGVELRHWFVSRVPMPVRYDPISKSRPRLNFRTVTG